MNKNYDEPKFIDVVRNDIDEKNENNKIENDIRKLASEQSFGVLATGSNEEPYSSLISFANTEDLKYIVFATPIDTRKFDLINQNQGVSLLIDNRSNQPKSINDIVALTAIGSVKILSEDYDREKWSKILVDKHSYLNEFISAKSTAIVLIEITKYFYVSSFQEVIEWTPRNN